MNTDDLPIPEYYKQQTRKNDELIGDTVYAIGIGIVIAILCLAAIGLLSLLKAG